MFQNPIMLAGLGGAMAPVVIHLLSRARYRSVEWGAMMFLDGLRDAPTESVGRGREFFLLAMRMAIVALLAMALARPVAGRMSNAASEPGRVTLAIVVDCSASMAHEDGGVIRMAGARAAALRALSGLRRGDQVCLIPAGGNPRQGVLFTGDLQAVGNRVSELKPAAGGADFSEAIDAAVEALSRQQVGEKRLLLVCDRQAASWASVDDATADDVRKRLAAMGANFTVIPVGSDSTENVSIESAAVANPPAVSQNTAQLEIKLHNYGRFERLGVPVVVRSDERDERTSTVNLPPQQSVTLSLPVKFASAGSHVVDVELHDDAADVDDRREILVDVAAPIAVLVIRDPEGEGRGEVDYLRAALAPFASAGQGAGDVASVENVTTHDWDEENLPRAKVVILDDVATLTGGQSRAIEQFVYGGGGLIVAPGSNARTNDYNRIFYREDGALLPALLQPAVSPAQALRIDAATVDTSHPLMHFLAEHAAALPGTIEKYLPVTGRAASAHVLASLSSGDPLVLEMSYGAGRVVMLTCGLDDRWSSLPLTNLYLPLMQSAVRFASGIGSAAHNISAGQEIVATFPDAPHASRAAIVRPDGVRDQADVTEFEDRSEVRYGDTRQAGIYTIRLGPRGQEQTARFAAAPSAEESDLSSLSEQRWKELASKFGFDRVSDVRRMKAVGEGVVGDYWLAMVVGVIALLVIEMGVTGAWWRGRGAMRFSFGRRTRGGPERSAGPRRGMLHHALLRREDPLPNPPPECRRRKAKARA